jgi:hypothetical protein
LVARLGPDPNVFGAGAVTAASFGPILDGIPAALDLVDGQSFDVDAAFMQFQRHGWDIHAAR